jgi:ribose/xylose/arabinose/galactoside ABC-type transport system permease subunit
MERVNSSLAGVFDRPSGSIIVGLVVLYLLGVVVDPGRFLQLTRVNNILENAATVAIMGYGVALLMITAEFDLSVESVLALTGGMALLMITELGINGPFTVLVLLVFAALYGITQGALVTQLELPSLIVTIGTLTGVRGILQEVIGTEGIAKSTQEAGILTWFGGDVELGDFPGLAEGFVLEYQLPVHDSVRTFSRFNISIVWALILLAVFHYLLFYTRFGHHVRATGDNIQSAGTTGVDPDLVKIACFAIVGVMAAFAGLSFAGRNTAVNVQSAQNESLFVIAAVVLGGTKLTGGEGTMLGALLGAIVLEVAQEVLRALGLGFSGWQPIVTGGFIIAAVAIGPVVQGTSVTLLRRWYLNPVREMLSSPTTFFRTRAVRKKTADMYGFLIATIGVTALMTNVVAWILGFGAVQDALGLDLSGFKLVTEGNWPETVAQVYMFLLLVAVVSFLVIEVVTQRLDSSGDYVDSLAAAAYGMLFAPLLAIPIAMYGFDIFFFEVSFAGSSLINSVLVALPVFLGMLWLMYVGVRELHEFTREKALAAVGGVIAVLLALAGAIAWSLTNVQPPA